MASERTKFAVCAVQKFLDDCKDTAIEKLAEEVLKQIESDDEGSRKKGYQIIKAYLENPVASDNMLMALCGWRMKSILIFAGLIPDDEGLLG